MLAQDSHDLPNSLLHKMPINVEKFPILMTLEGKSVVNYGRREIGHK